MPLYPLFADLSARPVLVVGGGAVAERKARALLQAGAVVSVGAPTLTPQLSQWKNQNRITHLEGHFIEAWLDAVWLVVAATNDKASNMYIAEQTSARRLFVNVVDDSELSSFHVPAVIKRGALTLAISSAGNAPALARRLREHLNTVLDESLSTLFNLAARYRSRILERYPEHGNRRQFYDWLHEGPVAALLRRAQPALAEQTLLDALAQTSLPSPSGHVILVGAGPGDPGLLTLKALRALNQADVIVHDRLIGAGILDVARRDAQRIDVGKRVGENHEFTQQRIHQLMRHHAGAGRCVVRLKGGDPFVFGRGGEELEYLQTHGISYEVVPGISAAIACAAYAGVPLTHRGHAASLLITTIRRSLDLPVQDWQTMARAQQTLAIYMAASQMDTLPNQLIAHGRAADTPFALVENGTRADQRLLTGRLDQLSDLARQHHICAPALLIVGEVAKLAPRLAWFGRCIHGGELLASAA